MMRSKSYRIALCFAACAWLFVHLGCTKEGGSTQNESTPGTHLASDGESDHANDSSGGRPRESGTPLEGSSQPPAPVNEVIPLGAEAPLPEPIMPHVVMTENHAATCLVNIGDAMPDFALADIEGNEHSLADTAGEKLTVIFLWTGQNITTRNALEDLEFDISAVRAEQGVRVVGVCVGDAAEKAGAQLEEAEVKFTALMDPDGTYFAKIATSLLPRVYVLNADRTIAWFDLEYSHSTRRQLLEVVRYLIDGPGGTNSSETSDASDEGSQ